ncbi:MAG TPA: hypothetical protein VEX18_20525 [Polyangiaceae bacterium]|nr:hypothetical protein [Polyangiaceae bacterium]
MSENDPSQGGKPPNEPKIAGTLLGVPAPRVESNAESALRSPVFVRAGTGVGGDGDGEPLPLPRMALPSRPLMPLVAPGASHPPPAERPTGFAWFGAVLKLPVSFAGGELSLWMLLGPTLLAVAGGIALLAVLTRSGPSKPGVAAPASSAAASAAPKVAKTKPKQGLLAELEGRSPESLSASELVKLAEGRAERAQEAAEALREKIEDDAELLKDKAVQDQLLRMSGEAETARDALAAMTVAQSPIGPDLLYEVWTGTTAKTDATELARALVYSKDIRPKASPALAVALDLRVAEKCEEIKAVMPRALKDGDRRVLHLLTKLVPKRGCGPKKNEDCYACLREPPDELTATINAVKSRKPPAYSAR